MPGQCSTADFVREASTGRIIGMKIDQEVVYFDGRDPAAPADVGFANPMTTAGDTIVGGAAGVAARQAKVMTGAGDLVRGGAAGVPTRLANPGAGTFNLQSVDGTLAWTAAP